MAIANVCILGGSGFLGRRVAEHLVTAGSEVRIPTRNRERSKDTLILLPTADVQVANIHDPRALRDQVAGCGAVVNLVGVLHDRRGDGFARNHDELPARLVDACRDAGVSRIVHVSALGAAADAPSAYLRSKAAGEARIREAEHHGIATTVFRPSVIFGPGDSFLGLFARLSALFPVLPLAGAGARFQPVFVDDVARCVAASLERREAFGQSYDLCGPKVYTLRELVDLTCHHLGRRRPIIALPAPLAELQAFALEHLPGKLMTRDNLASMSVDNVCDCAFPEAFGGSPTALEAVIGRCLGAFLPRSRYDDYRLEAGR